MELKGISLKDLEKKIRQSGIREKASDAYHKTKDFVTQNWRELLSAAVVVGYGAKVLGSGMNRLAQAKENKLKHTSYCYDRSLGHYWELRREPSNAEWMEINYRKKCGESMADILKSMGLIR